MSILYLCPTCCKDHDIKFFGMAENQVGRKSCSCCGSNQSIQLHILSQTEVKALAEKIRSLNP